MKAFTVSSKQLEKYDNWSAPFNWMLKLNDAPFSERLEAFWEWLKVLNVSPSRIDSILREAENEQQAVVEIAKIVMRSTLAGKRVKMTDEDQAAMLSFVKKLAHDFIMREQTDIESRAQNLNKLRSKFSIKQEAKAIVGELLNE